MRAPAALLAIALWACGAHAPAPDPLDARFEGAEARRAAELAPDFHARAERARAKARRLGGAAGRDHAERAELLLAAAEVEAARIALDRERAGLARQVLEAEQAEARDRAALREVQASVRRAEAARIARREAERVFQEAVMEEDRRRPKERDRDRAEAAGFLLRRARTTLAAARLLGAPAEAVTKAEAALERAASESKSGGARLAAAAAALAEAERAVGQARARGEAPSEAEVRSLFEEATQRGVHAESLPRGVVLTVSGAFRPGSARWSSTGKAGLAHLQAILRAHPHGPVQIEPQADASGASRSASLAASRADRARDALEAAAGVGARLQAAPGEPLARGNDLALVLPAYSLHPSPR